MRKYGALWHCVSSKNLPHDAVGVTLWLKRGDKGRKGANGMTVNQERDLFGRAENDRNLGRALP
jgi:hypothetical protein